MNRRHYLSGDQELKPVVKILLSLALAVLVVGAILYSRNEYLLVSLAPGFYLSFYLVEHPHDLPFLFVGALVNLFVYWLLFWLLAVTWPRTRARLTNRCSGPAKSAGR